MPMQSPKNALFPTTVNCLGEFSQLEDTPQWIYELDNPYLHGVYAPTNNINTHATNLEIEGEIPADMYGAYLRNGPNPRQKPSSLYHPFDGDGLVQGLYFNNGQVTYRSSQIQTAALLREQNECQAVWPGVMGTFDFTLPDFPIKDTANTDIIWHNGRLITLWYNAGIPYTLDPITLENLGPLQSPSKLTRKMSAHSRVDWETGEMFFFDFGDTPPYMNYGVLGADGRLKHECPIDLPAPRLPHEITFTSNHAILHDHPLFHDIHILRQHGRRIIRFHRDMPTRFGLIPRLGSQVTWLECEPCYVLHTSNAWEEGDWVVIDGCRSTNPMPDADPEEGTLSHMLAYMRLEANNYRWRLNLRTGEVREGPIDDLNSEFNKSNQLFHGVKTRYAYHQKIPLRRDGGHTLRFTGLIKYDNETGRRQEWDYGPGVFGSETPFVPKKGADRSSAEDDGYLTTFVTDTRSWRSSCLIFDARDITSGPLATVRLPHRIPYGFHGWWARGEDIYR
ncbi:carotenoid oxygenase family protein [uncultured Microbulbifer sp.]|uniref:carotenoid oxygenase family protein n=1 Tax=uncultured Microbulbifer sp. TaxID=348147 RepID=UPI002634C3B0|nr:carotenoid oxygenase family protein [uncultured Microbulbifer sp.]